jgi:hypothetical protein
MRTSQTKGASMPVEPSDVTAVRCRQRVAASAPRWLRAAPAYAIGPLAAFRLIERAAAFDCGSAA